MSGRCIGKTCPFLGTGAYKILAGSIFGVICTVGKIVPPVKQIAVKKTDRMGVMGRIKYDQGNQVVYGNDPAETAVAAVFQWTEDGKRKIVFPESVAEAKIQLPPGLKSLK